MAQHGFAPFNSAWGMNRIQTAGLIEMTTKEPRSPKNMPNIWITWYFRDITISNLTETVNARIGAITYAS